MSALRPGGLLVRRLSLLRAAPLGRARALASSAATADLPDHKLLTMPKLSPTMEVGTLQEWVKGPGDAIAAGDVLAEIETDKATRSFEYNDDGFLARVFVEEGQADVPVGDALALVVEEEGDIAAFEHFKPPAHDDEPASAMAATPPPAPAVAPVVKHVAPVVRSTGGRVMASPLARIHAAEAGVALSAVTGTGPGGLVVAADVAEAVASGAGAAVSSVDANAAAAAGGGLQPAAGAAVAAVPSHTDVDATKFQRVAAQRLTLSKQTVPHYYLTAECTVDGMLALRERVNAGGKEGGPRVSVNDFVIKAAAAALRRVPAVNAQWMEDKVRVFHSADICVAVQTPAGLITPIVRDAGAKGLREISEEVRELAGRAKEGKLAPEEFMGGTFTISNLGMFGVSEFAAIVNPPQAAILAVGASARKIVPDSSVEAGFGTRTVMNVTLSCDHRVVDGAVGAQWLAAFKSCLEDPVEAIL